MTSFRHESGEKSFGHIAGDANEGRSIIKKKSSGPRGRISLPDEDAPKAKGRRSLSEAAAKAKEKGKASPTSRLAASRKEAISSMVTRRPSARAVARKAKGVASKGASLVPQDTEGDQGDELSRQTQEGVEQASRAALSRARKALGMDAAATAKAPRGKAHSASRAARRAAASRQAIRRANVRAVRRRAEQKAAQAAAAKGAQTAAQTAASGGVAAKVAAAIGAAVSAVASTIAPLLAAIVPVIVAIAIVSSVVSAIAGIFQQRNQGIGSLTGVEAEVARTLKDLGYGNVQIAAIIGNGYAESGMNPTSENEANEDIGIWQFHAGNYHNFKNWCSQTGHDPHSASAQAEWLFGEDGWRWKNSWSSGLDDAGYYQGYCGVPEDMSADKTPDEFMAESSVDKATYSWMACYERCSNTLSHYADGVNRLENAKRVLAALEGSGAHGAAVTDVEWRQKVVDAAYSCIGWNYIYGVYSPATQTVDCSGLVTYCYSQVGVDIPHWSVAQREYCSRPASQAQPGDIVWTNGHVGICVGDGNTIEAMNPALGVRFNQGGTSGFVLAGSPLG